MREELKKLVGVRGRFTAKVERFGEKSVMGRTLKTILFRDVKDDSGMIVAEHLWFPVRKNMASAQLAVGDFVSLNGTVAKYKKGYKGNNLEIAGRPIKTDYCLKYPAKVQKISADEYNAYNTGERITARD